MIKGIIYKYTSPSGKVYIGQTFNEANRRRRFLNQHSDYAGPKINRARQKYGVENFEYTVIFRIESTNKSEVIKILDEKEIEFIELFDSFYNGYNSTSGGLSGRLVSEETKQKLSQSTKNYYKNHKSSVSKEVVQFSLLGKFIQKWDSARQASLELDILANNITVACKNTNKQAGGYLWRYASDFDEIPEKIVINSKHSKSLPVILYTLEGTEIKRWDTMSQAAIELGYSLGNFSTYCNGRNNHEYKGFLYYRGDKDLAMPPKPNDQVYNP